MGFYSSEITAKEKPAGRWTNSIWKAFAEPVLRGHLRPPVTGVGFFSLPNIVFFPVICSPGDLLRLTRSDPQ